MLRLASRHVAWDAPPFIIAEIGVNHDGRTDRAIDLVAAAASAGASAVKFQLFEADRLMSRAARLAGYQARAGEKDPTQMLRRLELSLDDLRHVVEAAHASSLAAIVTIFSVELVRPALGLPWDAFKSASPDIINLPLLRAMSESGRPLILSTGAADEVEIADALAHCGDAAFHCVSAYPTPEDKAQLAGIEALRALAARVGRQGLPVGYSDHTTALDTGALAVAAGALLLEKHLTHDRAAAGPDHSTSLDPDEFAQYVRMAERAWRMRGPREVCVQPVEIDVRTVSRQSVVAARFLPSGAVLGAADLTVKRPGGGISPAQWDSLIGRRTRRAVPADEILTWEDLEA